MAVNFDELLQKDAFLSIEPERKEALKKLAASLNGKKITESVGIVMGFLKSMPEGRGFTPAEQDAMLAAVMESLSPDEQAKLKKIFLMMNKPV